MGKALFLDIDGVLNSNFWNDSHQRILLWLKQHNDITGWVVLDDLDLHSIQIEQHQVKTDPTIGLTLEDIEKAEKILEGSICVTKKLRK